MNDLQKPPTSGKIAVMVVPDADQDVVKALMDAGYAVAPAFIDIAPVVQTARLDLMSLTDHIMRERAISNFTLTPAHYADDADWHRVALIPPRSGMSLGYVGYVAEKLREGRKINGGYPPKAIKKAPSSGLLAGLLRRI